MSSSIEHGEWRVKVTNELLINALDDVIEPIQKLLDKKDDKICELQEKIEELKRVLSEKDDTIDELSRVIRDNEYIPIAK